MSSKTGQIFKFNFVIHNIFSSILDLIENWKFKREISCLVREQIFLVSHIFSELVDQVNKISMSDLFMNQTDMVLKSKSLAHDSNGCSGGRGRLLQNKDNIFKFGHKITQPHFIPNQ